MPKNKKPAGGRPSRNFDPDYAAKRQARAAGARPGSRSPGHRGYRAPEEAPRKARWNAAERAERSGDRDETRRDDRRLAADRERPQRRFEDDRPRRFDRDDRSDDRGQRRFERDDRPRRRFEDDRPRRFGDDRAPRRPDREDRAPRRFDRDDRPARRPGSGDRPQRRFEDDRPRRFDRDDRSDDRGQRRFERDDRAPRRFERDDRPRRFDDDRGGSRSDRAERPQRRSDELPRRLERDERPRRFERDDRPRHDDRRSDRGPRRFDEDRQQRRRPERDDRTVRRDFPRDEPRRFTPADDVVLERLEADAIQAADVEGVTFADLGLGGNIVRTLAELGAEKPFPIQAATIPDVLAGRDVLGRGRTGSGKTIAFGAPLVERLMENRGGTRREMGRRPRALVLAPTRELALQIDRTVQPIARSVGLFTTQIYGGVPQARQVGALKRGVDIVIGTPGRIEDLVEQGKLDLSDVRITVLDEADHMCDLGFLEPVQRIIRHTGDGGQKLLFSATLDKGVAALVDEFLVEPSVHEVAGEDQASSTIDHRVLVVHRDDKDQVIELLADREEKTLVFARTRAYAERLAEQLEDAGIQTVALHGDLNQAKRTRNLHRFSSGRVNVVVATDVAARGIHVDDVTLVVQADMPDEYKTYLHRAGRTGRAGKEGRVVTIIPQGRRRRMTELLDRAEIEAAFVNARPDDDVIDEIAGRPTIADLTA